MIPFWLMKNWPWNKSDKKKVWADDLKDSFFDGMPLWDLEDIMGVEEDGDECNLIKEEWPVHGMVACWINNSLAVIYVSILSIMWNIFERGKLMTLILHILCPFLHSLPLAAWMNIWVLRAQEIRLCICINCMVTERRENKTAKPRGLQQTMQQLMRDR